MSNPPSRHKSKPKGDQGLSLVNHRHNSRSFCVHPVWQYITAFLRQKSPETERTYLATLREFSEFLGFQFGSTEAGIAFLKVDERTVLTYREWISQKPGIATVHSLSETASASFCESATASVSVSVGSGDSGRRRDGLQSSAASATIRKKLVILRRVYRVLANLCPINPFLSDTLTLPSASFGVKRPTQVMSDAEVQCLLRLPDLATQKGVQDRAILTLLFGCGLRRSEIVRLVLNDLRVSPKGTPFLQLRATKSGKDAAIPLKDWVTKAIESHLVYRRAATSTAREPLFVGFTGRGGMVPTTKPLSSEGLYNMFVRYCAAAHVALGTAPHAARATAITKLLDQGFSHREVLSFSRHASVVMVELYDKRRLTIEENPSLKLDYE